MGDAPEVNPGPNPSKSKRAVKEVLTGQISPPALSVGDIADRAGYSRRTVRSRIEDLENDDSVPLESGTTGGMTVYWIAEDRTSHTSGPATRTPSANQLGIFPVLASGGVALALVSLVILGLGHAKFALLSAAGGVAVLVGATAKIIYNQSEYDIDVPIMASDSLFAMVLVRLAGLSLLSAAIGFVNVVTVVFGSPVLSLEYTMALFAPAMALFVLSGLALALGRTQILVTAGANISPAK